MNPSSRILLLTQAVITLIYYVPPSDAFAFTLQQQATPLKLKHPHFSSSSSSSSCHSMTTSNSSTLPPPSSSALSPAAQWHQQRRKNMLAKYENDIQPLEKDAHGLFVGLPLLLFSNAMLASLSFLSASLSVKQIAALAFFPGSVFSLWQLQILHDCLHGTLLPRPSNTNANANSRRTLFSIHPKTRRKIQEAILFWCSMPSAFGYYLYLQYGHLTHHKSVGDANKASLERLFDSNQKEFEDGDVLFVAHRMKLKGGIGPKFTFQLPFVSNSRKSQTITMSISKTGFRLWKTGHAIRNALAFTTSFLFERCMLVGNDVVVALTGRNYFFPNKPKEFHKECAFYCRCAVLVRCLLCALPRWVAKVHSTSSLSWWKPLLFLYLAETLWSIPPHPACAMFITNHGSSSSSVGAGCVPSSSTYAGRWYSILTLGTNYHCEHHDFPTIPLHKLGKLRKIAPEFYRSGSGETKKDSLWRIMYKTFAKPEFYACMDAGGLATTEGY